MRLILYRALAGGAIALVLWLWFFDSIDTLKQHWLIYAGFTMLLQFPIQLWLAFRRIPEHLLLQYQYSSDVIVASLLVLATGGATSPFALLLGLIIIASGSHAWRALPLTMTMLATLGYLLASYGSAWLSQQQLSSQQWLHALLQGSALLLVGGVMAYICQRHVKLRASTDLAERRHRKLKDLHDKVMASMLEGVVLLDASLTVTDMNSAAETLLEGDMPEELLKSPALAEFLAAPDAPTFSCEYRQAACVMRVSVSRLSEDSDAVWLMTLVDITDIRRLEQQLVQQEKMAVLGQMAAMLAHEIRNPIQTMAQGLELMERNHASRDSVQEILSEEMSRLKRLVMTMLNYSQPLQPEPGPTWMPELLKQAVAQLDIAKPEEVEIRCQCNELLIDGDHLRLVLDNLLSNAVANRAIATPIELTLDADATNWRLSVRNEGEIPESVRVNLFEPFITGRAAGFGLGLATVKQVCLTNGWEVSVDSLGGYTSFTIAGQIAPNPGASHRGEENG